MKGNDWLTEMGSGKAVRFLPVYYYPELKSAGFTAEETLKEGGAGKMAAVMKAACERYPEIGAAMTALDVTVDPEAFGCEVMYDRDAAPHVVSAVVDRKGNGLETLVVPDSHAGRQDLHYEAVRAFKELMPDKPVFGNLLGPFTMAASVMLLKDAMICVMKKQEIMRQVVTKCTAFIKARAKAYKEAGADGLFLDEACSGIIPPPLSAEFSAAYIKEIVDEVQTPDFPVMYHNCGNIRDMKDSIFSTGCRIYSFGNMIDLEPMLREAPAGCLITGNLDPTKLEKDAPDEIYAETLAMLEKYGSYPGYVFSPGCDCPPGTKAENLEAMLRALRDYNDSRS